MYETKFYCESFDRHFDESHFKVECYILIFIPKIAASVILMLHFIILICLLKKTAKHLPSVKVCIGFWAFVWTKQDIWRPLLLAFGTFHGIIYFLSAKQLAQYLARGHFSYILVVKLIEGVQLPKLKWLLFIFSCCFVCFIFILFCCVSLSVLFFAGLPLLHTSFRFGSAG